MKKYVLLNGRNYEFIPLFTKKYHYYLKSYYFSNIRTITQAYKNPSPRKIEIYASLIDEMNKCGGYAFRILGKNTNFFSCAYTIEIKSERYLVIETPTKSYIAHIANDITVSRET